jgi:hypothetical protein
MEQLVGMPTRLAEERHAPGGPFVRFDQIEDQTCKPHRACTAAISIASPLGPGRQVQSIGVRSDRATRSPGKRLPKRIDNPKPLASHLSRRVLKRRCREVNATWRDTWLICRFCRTELHLRYVAHDIILGASKFEGVSSKSDRLLD